MILYFLCFNSNNGANGFIFFLTFKNFLDDIQEMFFKLTERVVMYIQKIISIPDSILTDQEKFLIISILGIWEANPQKQVTLEVFTPLLGWNKQKVKRNIRSLKTKGLLKNTNLQETPVKYFVNLEELNNLIKSIETPPYYSARTHAHARTCRNSLFFFHDFLNIYYIKDYPSLRQFNLINNIYYKNNIKKNKEYKRRHGGDVPDECFKNRREKLKNIEIKHPLKKAVKPTRNMKLIIKYWNEQSELSSLMEKKNKNSLEQTKKFKRIIPLLRKFFNGSLYLDTSVNFPHNMEPFERIFTVDDFRLFTNRFVQILTDKQVKPQNKEMFKKNRDIETFLIGSRWGNFPSILLTYCINPLETVVSLKSTKSQINCMKEAWVKINPLIIFGGKEVVELDKFIQYAIKDTKNIPRFKPRSGNLVSKIADVVVQTIEINWGKSKHRTLRPSYLNTQHFRLSFVNTIEKLGYS